METPEPTGFYFALPRLIARLVGGESRRSEQNWTEANVVGGAIHLLMYLAVAQWLLAGRAWGMAAALLPLSVLATWLFWLPLLYANAVLLKLLRREKMLRTLPNDRAQGLFIGIFVTLLALRLAFLPSWLHLVGIAWIIAVSLNLAAAAMLTLLPRNAES